MNYMLRTATKQDIPQIVKLSGLLADHHHAIDPYWKPGSETKKMFDELIRKEIQKVNVLWLVAEVDNNIIGYFSAEVIPAKPVVSAKEIGHISNAFLLDESRGKGIAKAATNQFFEWFKGKGVQVVEVTVDSRNTEGIRAWEGSGFKEYMKKMKLDL